MLDIFYFKYSHSYSFATVTDGGHLYRQLRHCKCLLQWLYLIVMLSSSKAANILLNNCCCQCPPYQPCRWPYIRQPQPQRPLLSSVPSSSSRAAMMLICCHHHRQCLLLLSQDLQVQGLPPPTQLVLLNRLLLSRHNLPHLHLQPPHTAVSFCSLCLPIAPALSPLP